MRFAESLLPAVEAGEPMKIQAKNNPNEEDNRYFEVQIGDVVTGAILLDLPCIIESMTTIDYINMFKCRDICQMIYVLPPEELLSYREPNSSFSRMLEKNQRYRARDGLTPGTKDIRARCFRREQRENPQDVAQVENLIKRVMESGSSQKIEEELIELEEGQPIPENTTEIIYPEAPSQY